MPNNYIEFHYNNNGVENVAQRDTSHANLVYGNNYAEELRAYITGRTLADYNARIIFTRPDGSTTNELTMTISANGQYLVFTLTNAIINQAGAYNFSIRLKQSINGNDVIQCTGLSTGLTYTAGAIPNDQAMTTKAEYQALLTAISTESTQRANADKKKVDYLTFNSDDTIEDIYNDYVAESPYHEVMVVKVVGEEDQEWHMAIMIHYANSVYKTYTLLFENGNLNYGELDATSSTTLADCIDNLDSVVVTPDLLAKTDYIVVNSDTTMLQLYTAIGQRPSVVKCGSNTLIITLGTYSDYYLYSALLIDNSSNSDAKARVWAKTYSIDKNKTIDYLINNQQYGIKTNNQRIQSWKDIDTLMNNYTTTSALNTLLAGKVGKTTDANKVYGTDGSGLAKFYSIGSGLLDDILIASAIRSMLEDKADQSDMTAILNHTPSGLLESEGNEYADKDFVNSSIQKMASFKLDYDELGNPFPDKATLLSATTFYHAGQVQAPTQNDHVVVQDDEEHDNAQVSYIFEGEWGTAGEGEHTWSFNYKINDEPFTTAQNNAINSGITNALVNDINTMKGGVGVTAQEKLTKQTGVTTYHQVYAKKNNGTNEMMNISESTIANAIVQRDSNGKIFVLTPTGAYDATNKQYVDYKTFDPTLEIQADGTYNFDM